MTSKEKKPAATKGSSKGKGTARPLSDHELAKVTGGAGAKSDVEVVGRPPSGAGETRR